MKNIMYFIGFLLSCLPILAHAMGPNGESDIQDCLYQARQYIAFEEDLIEFASGKCQQHQEDYTYNIQEQIQLLKKIRTHVIRLEQVARDEETIDSLLKDLLYERLFNIKCRAEERKFQRTPIITDQERRDNFISSEATYYRFLNQTIAQLFNLTSPIKLSEKTKFYIRLSQTLWPLLRGQIDVFSMSQDVGPEEELNAMDDLEYFDLYCDESQSIPVTYMNWGKHPGKHKGTPYERSLYDNSWVKYNKIAPLPYPSWLKPNVQPGEAREAAPEHTPPTPSSPLREEMIEDVAETTTNADLPMKLEVSLPLTISQQQEVREDNGTLDTEIEDATIEVLQPEPQEEQNPGGIHGTPNLEPPVEEEDTPNTPRMFARGNRVFHSQREATAPSLNIGSLGRKHQKTLEKIFKNEEFSAVTHNKFFALWKAINGEKSVQQKRGGSHIRLLNAQGKIVAGTFSHGGSMQYTHNTIKYIRDALAIIGYTPEPS